MFTKQTKSLLLVLVVLTAGAGVAYAAAPSVDTETADTSQTSDLTDGGTQTYNATTNSNFSYSADSADAEVKVKQNGTVLNTFSPTNYSAVNTTGTSDPDVWYYNVSVADDGSDYTGLIADANENVSLTYTIINNSTLDNPNTTNVTVYFENGEEHAFTRADSAEIAEEDGVLSSLSMPFSDDSSVKAAKATKTIGIDKNTTTVTFESNQQNLTDALGETHSAAKSSGYTTAGAVTVDGELVPLFTSSADVPDWMNNQTYATVDDSGTVTIENLDSDKYEIDVGVVGNENPGFFATFQMLRSYDAGLGNAVTMADVDANGNPDWVEA